MSFIKRRDYLILFCFQFIVVLIGFIWSIIDNKSFLIQFLFGFLTIFELILILMGIWGVIKEKAN